MTVISFKKFLYESNSIPLLYHGTTSNFNFNKGLLSNGFDKDTPQNFDTSTTGEIWLTSNREMAFTYALQAWSNMKDFSLKPIIIQVDIDVNMSMDLPIEKDQIVFGFNIPVISKDKLKKVKLISKELDLFKKTYDREVNKFNNGRSKFNKGLDRIKEYM